MASPVHEGATFAVMNANTTSSTVNKPTGVVSGEHLVHTTIWDETVSGRTWDTGFGEQYYMVQSGNNNSGAMADKVAGPAEPADYTVTWISGQHSISGMSRISGTDGTITLGSVQSGRGTSGTAPGMTAGTDKLVLAHFSRNRGSTLTPPGSPWSLAYNTRTAGPGDCSGGVSWQQISGNTGGATWSWGDGDNDYVARQFALDPIVVSAFNPAWAFNPQVL